MGDSAFPKPSPNPRHHRNVHFFTSVCMLISSLSCQSIVGLTSNITLQKFVNSASLTFLSHGLCINGGEHNFKGQSRSSAQKSRSRCYCNIKALQAQSKYTIFVATNSSCGLQKTKLLMMPLAAKYAVNFHFTAMPSLLRLCKFLLRMNHPPPLAKSLA